MVGNGVPFLHLVDLQSNLVPEQSNITVSTKNGTEAKMSLLMKLGRLRICSSRVNEDFQTYRIDFNQISTIEKLVKLPIFPDCPHLGRGGEPADPLSLLQHRPLAAVAGPLHRPLHHGLGKRRDRLDDPHRLPDGAVERARVCGAGEKGGTLRK